jgi:hypothetical protein
MENAVEFNADGTIKSASVRDRTRVNVRRQENDTVRFRLAVARTSGRVQLGQVAVFDEREWLRVRASKHQGSPWIEIV